MNTKLYRLLGVCGCDEEIADICLSMASSAVLDIIGRDKIPPSAESIIIQLAVIYFNRLGNEGETARTEGGISQSFNADIPQSIMRQLRNYPRKVGYINAT